MSSLNNNIPISFEYILPPHTKGVKKVTFSADEQQKEKLAHILEIETLHKLDALFHIERKNNKEAYITASIHAQMTQLCVISLESMQTNLNFSFERHLVKELFIPTSDKEEDWENLESDQDIWDGKHIDLASMIIEELSINIDPYPKKEGAKTAKIKASQISMNEEITEEKANPFTVLKQLNLKK